MENFKRVEIKFEDHYSLGDDWIELSDNEEVRILSAIGFLVKEDEKYFYVASTYDLNTEKYQAGTAVLKKCVVSCVEYDNSKESSGDDSPKLRRRRK